MEREWKSPMELIDRLNEAQREVDRIANEAGVCAFNIDGWVPSKRARNAYNAAVAHRAALYEELKAVNEENRKALGL